MTPSHPGHGTRGSRIDASRRALLSWQPHGFLSIFEKIVAAGLSRHRARQCAKRSLTPIRLPHQKHHRAPSPLPLKCDPPRPGARATILFSKKIPNKYPAHLRFTRRNVLIWTFEPKNDHILASKPQPFPRCLTLGSAFPRRLCKQDRARQKRPCRQARYVLLPIVLTPRRAYAERIILTCGECCS